MCHRHRHRVILVSAVLAVISLALLAALLAVPPPARAHGGAVPVILDTDVETDVDDAGAVAILHALADRGEAKVLGMVVDTRGQYGAPALDVLNTYYGRPDVPIGTLKPTTEGTESRYNRQLTEEFPNDLRSGFNAPDATATYRRLLAGQRDNSVAIVSVGLLTNLRNLLASGPDSISPLSGRDLVARKVKQLAIMGGAYPSGVEFNFVQDRTATAAVIGNWPGRMVFSGFEIGDSIFTGSRLFTETPATNPVRRAYELYVGAGNSRESWDLTAVYYAVRGGDRLFRRAGNTGSNTFDPVTGVNAWVSKPNKPQNYLVTVAPDAKIATALENLMVAPPR